MSVAAGAHLHKARHSSKKTKLCSVVGNGGANKIVFSFASVCNNFYCNVTESVERSKHGCIICGKKVSEKSIPLC